MERLAYGCGPIPTKRHGYFERHSALEVSEAYRSLVAGDTLHAWRKTAGKDFVMVLDAHRYLSMDPADAVEPGPLGAAAGEHGFLRPTAANHALWEAVDEQARALHANIVLLRTPAAFTPTRANIENLTRFRKQTIGNVPYTICWEAHGLWDEEDRDGLAQSLDMIVAIDPYVPFDFEPAPEGDIVYILRQPRGRRNFDRDDVADLLDYFEDHPGRVTALFRGGERGRNAFAFDAEYRRRHAEDTPDDTP